MEVCLHEGMGKKLKSLAPGQGPVVAHIGRSGLQANCERERAELRETALRRVGRVSTG